jgi:hypothetical protein
MILDTEYKTSTTKSKQRVFGGRFGNEFNGIPWITMDEEVITEDSVSGTIYHNQCGSVTAQLIDPTKTLTLRNPLDDSAIGSATYGDVMVMIYSLGRQLQLDRDVLVAAQKTVADAQAAYSADNSPENLTALEAAQAALATLQG